MQVNSMLVSIKGGVKFGGTLTASAVPNLLRGSCKLVKFLIKCTINDLHN